MRTSEVGNEVIIDDILNTSLVTIGHMHRLRLEDRPAHKPPNGVPRWDCSRLSERANASCGTMMK